MPLPIASCDRCLRQYWACACGASPLGCDKEAPPAKCNNRFCKLHQFRWVVNRMCCLASGHHAGSTCTHCGTKG